MMQNFDIDGERWAIKALANRYREKWPPDTPSKRHGFAKRVALGWFEIGLKLADIQAEYDKAEELYPRHLVLRALLAIWPTIMPYSWPPTHRHSRLEIKQARETTLPVLLALSMMAAKEGFTTKGFDYPRVIVRRRTTNERAKSSVQMEIAQSREAAEEAVGRAVLQEYRRHPKERRSLDSAILVIAERGSIDGVTTNSARSVQSRYHAYRRQAFARGFADIRAFWCQFAREAWPDDQVWLTDFPEA